MKINIAVIGCGRWGSNHIRVFSSLAESNLKLVVDSDEAKLGAIKKQYGVATATRIEKAIDDKQIDAVVIATPASSHYKLIKQALAEGKHVLCEKPLTTDSSEAEEIARLSSSSGKIVMAGNTFLFNPGIMRLKELIDKDGNDRVNYATSVRTNLGPIREDVGVLYDLSSHDIAIFNYIFGSHPVTVSATGGSFLRKGTEDVAFITLFYQHSIVANILVSWLNPRKVRQITVVSEKKMITWDEFDSSGPVTVYNRGVMREPSYKDYQEFKKLTMWESSEQKMPVDPGEPLMKQNTYFIEAIKKGFLGKSDPDFNVGVIKTLHAADESLENDGIPSVV